MVDKSRSKKKARRVVSDGLIRANGDRRLRGKAPVEALRAQGLAGRADGLARLGKTLSDTANVVKYGAIAFETAEQGPQVVIEEGSEELAGRLIHEKAGNIVGVGIELYKTNQAVVREKNAIADDNQTTLDGFYSLHDHLLKALCRGQVSPETFELVLKHSQAGLEDAAFGRKHSGQAEMGMHLTSGGIKATLKGIFGF